MPPVVLYKDKLPLRFPLRTLETKTSEIYLPPNSNTQYYFNQIFEIIYIFIV